jgi:sugar phosphate isomerase/epimerase
MTSVSKTTIPIPTSRLRWRFEIVNMKSAITLSLVAEARQGPFVFHDGLENGCVAAARHGFDAVEVFPPSANAIDQAQLAGLLEHHRLALAAVGTGGGWLTRGLHLTHPDAETRRQAREFIREIIDVAAVFGAPAIIGSMQGRAEPGVTREQALLWLGEALKDLGDHAESLGTTLLYEPLNRYETHLFQRQCDAADHLSAHGLANVRLLCDLFHMNIEETCIATTFRALGSHVGHVHFADSNRRAVGFGHTDAAAAVSALRDIGYAGYLSAEILPLPDAGTAAAQTMRSFRQLVTR